MNPPDRRQALEAPTHTYSNWTFIPTTISPLSEDKKGDTIQPVAHQLTPYNPYNSGIERRYLSNLICI